VGSKEIISHLRSDFLSSRDLLASSLLVYTLVLVWLHGLPFWFLSPDTRSGHYKRRNNGVHEQAMYVMSARIPGLSFLVV